MFRTRKQLQSKTTKIGVCSTVDRAQSFVVLLKSQFSHDEMSILKIINHFDQFVVINRFESQDVLLLNGILKKQNCCCDI